MLAFRSNVSSDRLFSDLLKQIKETTLEAYAHQEVPFEKVVDTIGSERDLSRNPLFQVTFILQNTPVVPKLQLGDLELSLENSNHNSAKFDLTFSITETDSELDVLVEYATDLFTRDTIIKMLGHYNELLNAVVKEPGQKVSALKMLTDAEEQQILIEFNNNQLNYDRDKSIIDLFQEQV
jgi:non-ribosomal peptide synthetase component F